jgi:hypothetical protein
MRYVSFMILALALVATVMVGQGLAAVIAITNGDFESSTMEYYADPPGWTSGAAGSLASASKIPTGNLTAPADQGIWAVYLNGGTNVSLTQTLGDTLEATTYVLSAKVAHFGTGPDGTAPAQYANTIAELLAGGTVLTPTSSVIPADPGGKNWATKSWTFAIGDTDPLLGQTLSIKLSVIGGGGQGDVDNVTLSSVPEPSTLVLVGIGLLGLLAYAWRKRK